MRMVGKTGMFLNLYGAGQLL